DVAPVVDQPFGQQKTRRQLEIIARRPHRDTCWAAVDTDFQRFLHSELIEDGTLPAVIPFCDLCGLRGLRRVAHGHTIPSIGLEHAGSAAAAALACIVHVAETTE